MSLNRFSCDIRESYTILPDDRRWFGQCLCIFLHPIPECCAMARCSILEVPPGLLPDGHDPDKAIGPEIIDLPEIDWTHPFIASLKAQAIQEWLRKLPATRKDLALSEDQLRALIHEDSGALPF